MNLRNAVLGIVVCVAATGANTTRRAAAGKDEIKRVAAATTVLEMMRAPDKAIPASILEKAEAIAIFPGVKKAGSRRTWTRTRRFYEKALSSERRSSSSAREMLLPAPAC